MTRASKPRRAGTKSGTRRTELSDDVIDAAEAALEDMLTQARGSSVAEELDEDDIIERTERRTKLPLPAPDTGPLRKQDHDRDRDETIEAITSRRTESTLPIEVEDDLDGEQIVTELPVLRVGVFEDTTNLRSAQSAIGATGHVVPIAASGRDGLARVLEAVRAGSLDAVLVALPGGEAIIDAALALEGNRPVVIASVDGAPLHAVQRASSAGADLAVVRPHDAASLAPLMLAATRLSVERKLAADPERAGLLAFEAFQRVLELAITRAQKHDYPLSVALFAIEIDPPPPPGIGGIVRARAGNALIHAIRDIDAATQLEGERFLVLMPYTDLKRAAGLAQKVISAVGQGEPVVSAGRAYPPRVVGAIAAAKLGEPISFAKLVKDATRTLEQARRDGADLAVQP